MTVKDKIIQKKGSHTCNVLFFLPVPHCIHLVSYTTAFKKDWMHGYWKTSEIVEYIYSRRIILPTLSFLQNPLKIIQQINIRARIIKVFWPILNNFLVVTCSLFWYIYFFIILKTRKRTFSLFYLGSIYIRPSTNPCFLSSPRESGERAGKNVYRKMKSDLSSFEEQRKRPHIIYLLAVVSKRNICKYL